MVRMTGSNAIPLSSLLSSGSPAGRVGVPVAKSQALYAQFEHVYGVPTEGGVRVDRVKILNTLIDRLSSIKRDRGQAAPARENAAALSPERLDALIEQYGKDIKAAVSVPAAPYRPRPSLPQAVVFNILA